MNKPTHIPLRPDYSVARARSAQPIIRAATAQLLSYKKTKHLLPLVGATKCGDPPNTAGFWTKFVDTLATTWLGGDVAGLLTPLPRKSILG
jgi:hypothetical protein